MADAQPSEIVSGEDAPPTQEGALKAAKAQFNKLLAKQAQEPDLNQPFPEQTLPGRKPKKASQKAKEAPEAEEAVEASAEEKPSQKAAEKPKELTGERAKLALAGIPRRIIDNLSDDEVGEAWKKQEEREQATRLALQRASDLEKRLPQEATSKQSEPQAGVPTDELDLDEITDSLADQFGEEEAGVLAKALAAAIKPLQEENRQIRTILDNARQYGERQVEKSNRERLSEKLPMLAKNDRAWDMLNAAVKEDIKKDPKKFSSANGFFDDAFDGMYGEVLAAQAEAPAEEDDKADEKARIAASSHTPPATTKRRRAATPMDAHKAAFEHLVEHADDVEGARKTYGRFLVQ